MFFKRSKVNLNRGPIREIAWDDKTVEWIAQTKQLNVRITHVWKTVSLGQSQADNEYRDRAEWAVHGVMTSPKFIPVSITFAGNEKDWCGDLLSLADRIPHLSGCALEHERRSLIRAVREILSS